MSKDLPPVVEDALSRMEQLVHKGFSSGLAVAIQELRTKYPDAAEYLESRVPVIESLYGALSPQRSNREQTEDQTKKQKLHPSRESSGNIDGQ